MLENLVIEKLAPVDERILTVINFLSEENFDLFIQTNLKEFDNLEQEKKDKFKELTLRQAIGYYLSCDGEIYVAYLNDEIIVTVIATGFEDKTDPLYHAYSQTAREEIRNQAPSTTDDDDDASIPSFLRKRGF